ncbi:PD-(D/E)XK nuclease family protein, partial [bacterium]|nr:PD-(D/E)XK nuclease family protein [bacterium]
MKLISSDFHAYYRPSRCELRVYLQQQPEVKEAPAGPYEQVLRRLGVRHEQAHLGTFPEFINLAAFPSQERITHTIEAVRDRVAVLYQPFMRACAKLKGIVCEILGEPDFMLTVPGGYVIRDVKISRRIDEKDHPEIIRQLQIYGWLYEQTFNQPPVRLEVYSGAGKLEEVPYDEGHAALGILATITELRQLKSEPYSPVGWTKCAGCGFHGYCWPRAEKKQDVALVADVDQGLAGALRDEGIETVSQFREAFDETRLANYQRPWGNRTQRVGKKAGAILLNAKAMADNKEIFIQKPELPEGPNYVMFDLEGLPPQLNELQKIYLWGMQVFGETPGEFQAATAGFGEAGDSQGWEDFLAKVKTIFQEHGDIPFVHWHHYERTNVKMYIERFGDPDGIAERVLIN